MTLKVDIRVALGAPLPGLVDFIRRCEDAGFNGVGVHDHPESGRDVFAALTLAASHTSRLTFYPAVTNGVSRHPLVLASVANSVEEVAPRRMILVVGAGDVPIRRMGLRPATIDQLRDIALTVRRLLGGEAVRLGVNPSERLVHTSHPPTPVYIACGGPRGLEMAGEVADGVLVSAGIHPAIVAQVRRHVAEGARRVGRDPKDIPIIFLVQTHIDRDLRAARAWAHNWIYQFSLPSSRPELQAPRWNTESYRYWLRGAGLVLPADFRDMTEEQVNRLCDDIGIFGPPEYCAERLQRASEEAGVDHIFLLIAHAEDETPDVPGMYMMPEAELAAFQRVILPRLLKH